MTNGGSCVTVKLLTQNRQEDQPFVINKITQDMQFRQSLLKYASKCGVTKTAIVPLTPDSYVCKIIFHSKYLLCDFIVSQKKQKQKCTIWIYRNILTNHGF